MHILHTPSLSDRRELSIDGKRRLLTSDIIKSFKDVDEDLGRQSIEHVDEEKQSQVCLHSCALTL